MAATRKPKVVATPQPFEVRRSSIQGRGGFATRDIRKGERIVEYVGERISWKQADERYDDEGMRRHHTFLFAVTSRTVIDGAVDGNDSRFINHACDPNCEAVDDNGRIYVEAIRPIAAGEELFYDYAYARDETTSEEDEAHYVCKCGSPKCRGSILEPPKKAARLPKTHHVAARHPHEHLGAADGRPPSKGRQKTKVKTKVKSKGKTKPKPKADAKGKSKSTVKTRETSTASKSKRRGRGSGSAR
jgi:hypothetical protein